MIWLTINNSPKHPDRLTTLWQVSEPNLVAMLVRVLDLNSYPPDRICRQVDSPDYHLDQVFVSKQLRFGITGVLEPHIIASDEQCIVPEIAEHEVYAVRFSVRGQIPSPHMVWDIEWPTGVIGQFGRLRVIAPSPLSSKGWLASS